MKYMFLTYLDEKAWLSLSKEEQQRQMDLCAPHVEKLNAKGKLLAGAPLNATTTATTIRIKDGKRVLTDGPFAETREQLGGYTIVEANDLDEAIAMATGFLQPSPGVVSVVPATIEVRPIVELQGLKIV